MDVPLRGCPLSYILYWICILVTAFANAIVEQMNIQSLVGPVSGVATMGAQSVLAKVFADTFQLEFKFWKRSLPIFILGIILGFSMGAWTSAFEAYAFPMVLGATFPVMDVLWQAYLKKRHQWTSTQKLNGLTLLLMSLHYLDWPFTRNRPEYFFLGLVVAFVLLHLLSILMPMLVNEKILADKNPDNGFLYVLDSKNKRVVVLSKSGKYQAQYVFPNNNDLLDIELLPGLTKDQLMVMTQSGKVIQVDLNLGH